MPIRRLTPEEIEDRKRARAAATSQPTTVACPEARAPSPPPVKDDRNSRADLGAEHTIGLSAPSNSAVTESQHDANRDENGEYIVGKYRTPVEHRWKKGQSGNPRGRKPRPPRDPQSELRELLLQKDPLKVNGKTMMLDLGGLATMLLKNHAVKGDRKAAEFLFNVYVSKVLGVESPDVVSLSAEDQALIRKVFDEAGIPAANISLGSPNKPTADDASEPGARP